MSHRRWMHLGNRVWAPRALAVLSCALALLAAQPVPGETARHRAPLPVSAPALSPVQAVASPTARAPQVRTNVSQPETTFFTSARRLHILATVEILKRLLVAELQPPVDQMVPVLLLEPMVCVDVVAAPLNLPGVRGAPDYPSLPPPEHQFLLVHTQLAPPSV